MSNGAVSKGFIFNPLKLRFQFKGQDVCIVFHCEFSRNREPTVMRMFRDYDRRQNMRNYPELCFPIILLLEGG